MKQFTSVLLLVAAVGVGCKKSDKAPAAGSGSGSAVTPPATPPPAPPAAPVVDTDSVASIAMLDAFVPPPPPKTDAPATAKWLPIESTKVGSRNAYFGEGKDDWMDFMILDCNLPRMKDNAKKPPAERSGDAPYCLDPMDAKLKDYPMSKKYPGVRSIKVGHLVISVNSAGKGSSQIKDADLEAWLGSIDPAALAKLNAVMPKADPNTTIVAKVDGADAGPFDGTKAVLVKKGDSSIVVVPSNCDTYSCALAGADGSGTPDLWKACPSVKFLMLTLSAAPAVGPAKFQGYVGGASSGNGLTSNTADGITFSEVAADHATAKIEFKDGAYEAHGGFVAKSCP